MRTASALAAALLKGERRALSKAITLVESTRPASRESADELLSLVLPHRDRLAPLRIGISGAPGTGGCSRLV
jgi:LAO/AO transport system kinase